MSAFPEWSDPLRRCNKCNIRLTVQEGRDAAHCRPGNLIFHIECHAAWLKMTSAAKTQLSKDTYALRKKEKELADEQFLANNPPLGI